MAYRQTYRNAWLQAVEQYLVATTALPGEQLVLPDGLPEPPANRVARALVYQLHHYADPSGGSVRPTYSRLAKVNACSVDTIRRAMQTLEGCGLITRYGVAYRGKAQMFRLNAPAYLPMPKGFTSAPLTAAKGGTGAPLSERKGGTGAAKGLHGCYPTIPPSGDGPYVTDDAPPRGARVTEPETSAPVVVPFQRARALTVACPDCEAPAGRACRGMRPGRFHDNRSVVAS